MDTTGRGALYAESRARITALVRSCSPEQLAAPVPATPGWTVQDVVAHLAGATSDIAAGLIEGAGSDPWTAKQVADRKGRSIDELIAEWEQHAPGIEQLLDQIPQVGNALADIVTHEQDIAAALGCESGRGSDSYDAALQLYLFGIDRVLRKRELPALEVRAGDQQWTLGEGEPVASVTVDAHELFRAVAGRRSPAQIRAWDWQGDPGPSAAALSVLGPSPTDVVEPV